MKRPRGGPSARRSIASMAGGFALPQRARSCTRAARPRRVEGRAVGEGGEEVGGKGEWGGEKQRLFSTADDRGDGLKIDLGLTRAGDAIEQRDAIAARGHRRA